MNPTEPTSIRPNSPVVILNDDVLLNIFNIYRLDITDEEEDENVRLVRRWDRQLWWYKFPNSGEASFLRHQLD